MSQNPAARFSSERGAVILVALCFATVLLLCLGSYLTVCYRTLEMSSRSVQGARSVELAESGMEEALWALNQNDWNGWSIDGTTATKTVSAFTYENGASGSISLTITNYDGSGGTRTVTVTGTTQETDGTGQSRTLTSNSTQAPLFVNALAGTTSTVTFQSSGSVDSYNAADGSYASQTPGYSAILASTATTSSATVQLVNAQVQGYVASNYAGGPSYSSEAMLLGPDTPGPTKIDTSRISTSPYQPVFTINFPSGSSTNLSNPLLDSTTTVGTPGATVPTIYRSTGIDMRGTTKIIVDGPVQWVITGNFYLGLYGGSPSIEVTANGSLEIFAANDIAVYGDGMENASEDPTRMAIFGTNTLTVPDFSTAQPYHGVIYTPTGQFTLWGNATIFGAIVAKKVTLKGSSPAIHYDLNLRQTVFDGIETPYIVTDWIETTLAD